MSLRLRLLAFPFLVLALGACAKPAHDDATDTVSATVTTRPVHKGSLPDLISAYGTAVPTIDAASTLSIHAEGTVTRLDVMVGAPVRRGQALLTFTLSPAAVSAYQQARTALDVARGQREHTAQLLARRLATKDQLAQADKVASDARSALDALRKQQGAGSTVDLAAPVDGIVSSLSAAQGEFLQPGAPLLTVVRGNGVVVSVGVEMDVDHPVAPGDTVTLVPMVNGPIITGVVKRVAGVLEARTHLQNVDITPKSSVICGMGYRADIHVGQWSGWLLPRDALVGNGRTWHVFQVASGKAIEVPVSIVGESETVTVVTGALDATRPLVVVGNTQIEDGMQVRVTAQAEPDK